MWHEHRPPARGRVSRRTRGPAGPEQECQGGTKRGQGQSRPYVALGKLHIHITKTKTGPLYHIVYKTRVKMDERLARET